MTFRFGNFNLSSTLPREFALAAACSIWPPSERRDLAIRDAFGEGIDWDRFLRIVKRQRVVGLVHDGLARAGILVPPALSHQIQHMAAGIARQNLQYAAESLRMQRLFDEAGVPLLFVKGVTLALLAYESLALKHSWDIDILVMPDDVPKALQLLAEAGYRAFPPLPSMTDRRYRRWISFGREYVLYHETNSVHIELHWKLMENDYYLPGKCARSPSQLVTLSTGAELRTLVDDDLFAYLCLHGATHGWSRLKWLADVAALMARDTASDARRRLQVARKVNTEVCVAQTFLLCDRLFGTPSVASLSRELRRSYRNRWLERAALSAMTKGGAETELGGGSFDIFPIYVTHFMLGRGWRFVAGELWNKLNSPYDLHYTALPDWLRVFYPLFRLATWIRRGGRIRPLPVPPKGPQE